MQVTKHPALFTSTTLAAAPLLVATPGLADETEAAKATFLEGIAQFEAKAYDDALTHFEESYALHPSPVVLFNIAMCQKALSRYADAAASFDEWLATSRSTLKQAIVTREELTRLTTSGRHAAQKTLHALNPTQSGRRSHRHQDR